MEVTFTDRQVELIAALGEGLTLEEAGERLGIQRFGAKYLADEVRRKLVAAGLDVPTNRRIPMAYRAFLGNGNGA